MHKPEETLNDHPLLPGLREEPEHDLFSELIERDDHRSDQRNATIWRPEQQIRWIHAREWAPFNCLPRKRQYETIGVSP
jgi:hypothetical protein